jgi:hypothetical protein
MKVIFDATNIAEKDVNKLGSDLATWGFKIGDKPDDGEEMLWEIESDNDDEKKRDGAVALIEAAGGTIVEDEEGT